jgi:hypothetical protein
MQPLSLSPTVAQYEGRQQVLFGSTKRCVMDYGGHLACFAAAVAAEDHNL